MLGNNITYLNNKYTLLKNNECKFQKQGVIYTHTQECFDITDMTCTGSLAVLGYTLRLLKNNHNYCIDFYFFFSLTSVVLNEDVYACTGKDVVYHLPQTAC